MCNGSDLGVANRADRPPRPLASRRRPRDAAQEEPGGTRRSESGPADDRRDAAQMRIEELVRDAEFDEDSHREGTRMSPTLIVGLALTGIGVVLALLWLRSLCL